MTEELNLQIIKETLIAFGEYRTAKQQLEEAEEQRRLIQHDINSNVAAAHSTLEEKKEKVISLGSGLFNNYMEIKAIKGGDDSLNEDQNI